MDNGEAVRRHLKMQVPHGVVVTKINLKSPDSLSPKCGSRGTINKQKKNLIYNVSLGLG